VTHLPAKRLIGEKTMKTTLAALIHNVRWNSECDGHVVSPGVCLRRIENSPLGNLYHLLCHEHGIDDGDPFGYETAVCFEPPVLSSSFDYGEPHAMVDRFLNILTIVLGQPPTMCRVIRSADGFVTSEGTETAYVGRGQSEFLERGFPAIDEEQVACVARAWRTSLRLWERGKALSRVHTALRFFHYAWHASDIEQILLNTAASLAFLAPGDADKLIDALPLEATWTSDPPARATLKGLLHARSSLLAGMAPTQTEMIDAAVPGFQVTAAILAHVLQDAELADTIERGGSPPARLEQVLGQNRG
jgi:hypothetical protein